MHISLWRGCVNVPGFLWPSASNTHNFLDRRLLIRVISYITFAVFKLSNQFSTFTSMAKCSLPSQLPHSQSLSYFFLPFFTLFSSAPRKIDPPSIRRRDGRMRLRISKKQDPHIHGFLLNFGLERLCQKSHSTNFKSTKCKEIQSTLVQDEAHVRSVIIQST